MNSKARVSTALAHKEPDRVPVDYWAAPEVTTRLCSELGFRDKEELLCEFGVDLRYVEGPSFVGQERKQFPDGTTEDLWGVKRKKIDL
ncbi:MAG: uroporphyrinogen-III decarboxylase, partial [Pseudomonadota bacterium]